MHGNNYDDGKCKSDNYSKVKRLQRGTGTFIKNSEDC